ncbi:hypothetical protein ACIQC7_34820 [Kitasatospora sp. NPDC088556]|uniref:hypothetical protein n=1 Tax=Kitasatospora sp. NPDC088556 TaxID=3364076 RepID=UPI0037F9E681
MYAVSTTMPTTTAVDAGRSWLAYWSPDPGACLAAWDGGGLGALTLDYDRVVALGVEERECAGSPGSARPQAAGEFLRAARRTA